MSRSKREQEPGRRLEIHDALEAKKRQQGQRMMEDEERMRDLLLGDTSDRSAAYSPIC